MSWRLTLIFVSILVSGCTARPKVPAKVPNDFQLEYRLSPIGVTPAHEKFIRIDPPDPETGKAPFTSGTDKRFLHETPQRTATTLDREGELSAKECLDLYQLVITDGFLGLEDAYSSTEDIVGGASRSLSVTANGSTKRVVLAANATVSAFELLAKRVHERVGLGQE